MVLLQIAKAGKETACVAFMQTTGLEPKRTSIQALRQNGTAERWITPCKMSRFQKASE
jgi:hypothetical protein